MALITLAQDRGVASITLDRAEKRNALNAELLDELYDALRSVQDAETQRVVLLTGSGATFSAGADLSPVAAIADADERRRAFADYAKGIASRIERIMDLLDRPELTSVCAVNGHAVGGGWMLALACDFRIMASDAEIWFPEAGLGRAVGEPSIRRLVGLLGPARTKEMVMTSRRYPASELHQLGLVTQVLPTAEVVPSARNLAAQLAALQPATLATVKSRIADARSS